MTDMPEGEEAFDPNKQSYGLVMPFVTVVSSGGPHDDDAYAAGYRMGLLDGSMTCEVSPIRALFDTESQHQADLLAMRHGYTMKIVGDPEKYGEIVEATFNKKSKGLDYPGQK